MAKRGKVSQTDDDDDNEFGEQPPISTSSLVELIDDEIDEQDFFRPEFRASELGLGFGRLRTVDDE